MEAAFENTLAKDMALHGRKNVGARGVGAEIELGIESEEFEGVVMIGTLRTHARSHEADSAAQVLGVDGAVVKFRGGGNALRKSRLSSPVRIMEPP